MNAPGWRRWVLQAYVVTLVLWAFALVVDFVVFDGPTSPLHWIMVGVVFVMLIALIVGELRARSEGR